MEQNDIALKTALLASASFAGYNIGSGFATGLEGQQFFVSLGTKSAFVGILIAMIATALIFVPVYLLGYKNKSEINYNIYKYYCGDKLGSVLDLYINFNILLIILVMMSGAGATINQYFGIPNSIGTALLGGVCILATLLDLRKLMRVLSNASIIIIAFVLGSTLYIRFIKGATITVTDSNIQSFVNSGDLMKISFLGKSNPIISGVISSGLLVVSGLPWVASTGALCENKKSAILSGALSGLVFYLAQSIVVYLNLISLENIIGAEIPILAVFQNYLPVLALIYSGIIMIAIFSTVSGRLFLFSSRYDKGSRKNNIIISIVVVILSAIGGTFIPFGLISNIMFKINGFLGLFLAILILAKTFINK